MNHRFCRTRETEHEIVPQTSVPEWMALAKPESGSKTMELAEMRARERIHSIQTIHAPCDTGDGITHGTGLGIIDLTENTVRHCRIVSKLRAESFDLTGQKKNIIIDTQKKFTLLVLCNHETKRCLTPDSLMQDLDPRIANRKPTLQRNLRIVIGDDDAPNRWTAQKRTDERIDVLRSTVRQKDDGDVGTARS